MSLGFRKHSRTLETTLCFSQSLVIEGNSLTRPGPVCFLRACPPRSEPGIPLPNHDDPGFPGGGGKESTCQSRSPWRHGLGPWMGKIPWRRKWQPTPLFWPGKSHGQRSLAGYSSCHRKSVWHDRVTKQSAFMTRPGRTVFAFFILAFCCGCQVYIIWRCFYLQKSKTFCGE